MLHDNLNYISGPIAKHAWWPHWTIISWSFQCVSFCFQVPVQSTSVEGPHAASPHNIRQEYGDLQEVFSKTQATHLPPYQPWHCAIDFLPAHGKVYRFSKAESLAMETYIAESLNQGFTHPSSSPALAIFFFVLKIDGGLHPCINYRGLNTVMVKYKYLPPLIFSVPEQLHGACYFTKLDLQSAYNLLHISKGDKWKTTFRTTSGHYGFLGDALWLADGLSVFQAGSCVAPVLTPWRQVLSYFCVPFFRGSCLQLNRITMLPIMYSWQWNWQWVETVPDHCSHQSEKPAAKHLNPQQARWALLFFLFIFTISYQPGTKNVKVYSFLHVSRPLLHTWSH